MEEILLTQAPGAQRVIAGGLDVILERADDAEVGEAFAAFDDGDDPD